MRDPRLYSIGETRWLRWTGVPVVVVGLIVIAAWLTGAQILTTFVSGGSPLVMNTAISLTMCGAGLIALGLLGASVLTARRSTAARKLAESSLITANQLQRAVLDGTRFAVIATKVDGTIQVFNAGAEKMLGYTRGEVVGGHSLEFVHVPEEIKARAGELTVLLGRKVEPGLEAFVAQAKLGRADEREWTYVRKDGSKLPVLVSITLLTDPAGLITGFLSVAQDLTDSKRTEVALQAGEERLHRVLSHADCLVWEAGVTLTASDWSWVMTVHPSGLYRRLTGEKNGTTSAGLWYQFEIPEREEMNQRCRTAMESGATGYEQEFRLLLKGQISWIKESVSITSLGSGRFWMVGVAVDATESKRVGAARDEVVGRLHKLGALVPGMIFQFRLRPDGSFCIPYASEGIRQIYRVSPEEVREDASNAFAVVHPDDLAGLTESIRESARSLQIWQHEYRVRYADGTVRWLLGNSVPEREADGSVLWHGFINDITERKHTEKELRQNETILRLSEERLSNIYRAMADGLVLQDGTARILECNPAAERILGLSRDQIMGRTSLDPRWHTVRSDGSPLPGDEHPAIVTIRTGRTVRNFEMGVYKPDSSVTWISINTEPLTTKSGAVREVICGFSDITERKNLEESVHRERELLRTVIDLLPSPIYLKDRDSRFLMVNQALARCLAKDSPAQLVSLCDFDLFDSEVASAFRADDEAVLAGLPVRAKEETTLFPNGEKRTYMTTKVPFRDAQGNVTGILGIGVDITERKQLQDSLALARDQALEASRLKSEFLANMSHEIRTPMNGIVGMAELLMDSILDDDQREMGRVIQISAENLLGIINDILDFSKIEAGKLRIEPVEMDLRAVVDDAIVLLLPLAEKRRLELTCEFDPAIEGLLLGDSGRIRQVLLNLAGNAVKFTLKGRVSIMIRQLEERTTEREIEVRIQDTGIGISPAAQKQLFQAVTQADGSTTRRFGGTGLGLAISRQLVDLMGGEIGLMSEEGRGSTFWFRLTLPKVSREHESTRSSDRSETLSNRIQPGLRFLVAEDNITNQMVARGFLEKMGHHADFAFNGNEVLELLRRKSYDAILMDCQMSEMDGYTAARCIRADEAKHGSAAIPIIALTAFAMATDRAKCLEAGMNDYLSKPLRAEELQQALVRCNLAQRNGPAPVDAPAARLESSPLSEALAADHVAQLRGLPGRGHPTLLEEVAEIFLRETPDTLSTLRQLADRQEFVETARLAHRLAGSAASIGGQQMQAAAQAVESAAGRGVTSELAAALAKLDREGQRVRSELEQLQFRSP
ncbi:MAG: PAS domain S-box protein [Lacunisphaera sp.]